MSLHNDVMNIPCKYTRSCFPDEAQLLAYKEGHRDARHEAAEMALAHICEWEVMSLLLIAKWRLCDA